MEREEATGGTCSGGGPLRLIDGVNVGGEGKRNQGGLLWVWLQGPVGGAVTS